MVLSGSYKIIKERPAGKGGRYVQLAIYGDTYVVTSGRDIGGGIIDCVVQHTFWDLALAEIDFDMMCE